MTETSTHPGYTKSVDTHTIVKTLTNEYRMPTKHAEGVLYAIFQAHGIFSNDLATKKNVDELREQTKDEFANVKTDTARLEVKVDHLQTDVTDIKTSHTNLEKSHTNLEKSILKIRSLLIALAWIIPLVVTVAVAVINLLL